MHPSSLDRHLKNSCQQKEEETRQEAVVCEYLISDEDPLLNYCEEIEIGAEVEYFL